MLVRKLQLGQPLVLKIMSSVQFQMVKVYIVESFPPRRGIHRNKERERYLLHPISQNDTNERVETKLMAK